MRTIQYIIVIILFFILNVSLVGQTKLSLFNAELTHKKLNPSLWHLKDQKRDTSKGLFLYIHKELKDSSGMSVTAAISIIYEALGRTIPKEEYAEAWQRKMKAVLDKKVTRKDLGFVIYYYHYDQEIRHNLVVAYFVCPGNGIQIMADAPSSMYKNIETDVMDFIKSIKLYTKK
jgi:hypothetical protein